MGLPCVQTFEIYTHTHKVDGVFIWHQWANVYNSDTHSSYHDLCTVDASAKDNKPVLVESRELTPKLMINCRHKLHRMMMLELILEYFFPRTQPSLTSVCDK